MSDVAHRSGVHQATVSRVLNRPEVVKTETLRRVHKAIEELEYAPHTGARHLAGGHTGVIAAFVPDLANPFFAALLKAIQAAAHNMGSRVMVADTQFDAATEIEIVKKFAASVDAAVLCSPVASTAGLLAAAGSTQLVFVNRAAVRVPSVVVDQAEIVNLAVDHHRQLGHRHIAVVTGPSSYWSSAQRLRAAQRLGAVHVIDNADPTFEGGAKVLGSLLDADITAVVAFNDLMALGILRAAVDHGLSVPNDLSVVGSDNIEMAAMSSPALTTVAAPIDELGQTAVSLIDWQTSAKKPRSRVSLPTRLIDRTSTAPRTPRPAQQTRG